MTGNVDGWNVLLAAMEYQLELSKRDLLKKRESIGMQEEDVQALKTRIEKMEAKK